MWSSRSRPPLQPVKCRQLAGRKAAGTGAAHRLLNVSILCEVLQKLLLSCLPRQAPKEESTAARLCRCSPVARHCTSGPCINLTASSVDWVVAYPPLRTYPQQSSPLLSGLPVTLARAARGRGAFYIPVQLCLQRSSAQALFRLASTRLFLVFIQSAKPERGKEPIQESHAGHGAVMGLAGTGPQPHTARLSSVGTALIKAVPAARL